MNNTLKTLLLLGTLSLLIIFLGNLIGGQQGLISAFIFSLILNGGAYFFSDKLALMASEAQPVNSQQWPHLYNTVHSLSQTMNLPTPKIYVIPEIQANAFATGRNPKHASIALTQGLLQSLPPSELEAVIAHELAHIKNHDILIASIAAVLASTISFLANLVVWNGSSDDDNHQPNILGIITAILLPFAASIIQLAISREREYAADYSGAKALGTGEPLANALLSIHQSANISPIHTNPAYASLYITNPLGTSQSKLTHLSSTHPPVKERIARLNKLTFT